MILQQEPKKKYFIESIPYEQVNTHHKRSNDFKNLNNIENKLTRFQIYQETEFACKYVNPLYKTQYSEILVEYEQGFDMTTGKLKLIHTQQQNINTTENPTPQLISNNLMVNQVEN